MGLEAMSGLDQTAHEYLQDGGREVSYSDGETIIHRGEQGRAFYVVISGRAEVLLAGEEGNRLPLARLGRGATFGEMSLLTDQPVSADVVARSEVTLLEYPRERFQTALAECAALRNYILSGFCASLRQTNEKAWQFFQRSEALEALMHTEGRTGEIIAESAAMRRVQDRIDELVRTARVILISGPPGTGKLFVARKIHEAACDAEGGESRLIIVDCARLGPGEAARMLFGPREDRRFHAGPASWSSLPLSGALDLADGGTLILQHVDSLDVPARTILARYLQAAAEGGEAVAPHVRVIATTSKDLDQLAGEGPPERALIDHLAACTLAMPTQQSRRRDILLLANLFLRDRDQRDGDGEHCFNTSAEHALLSAQYRHRNVAELRDAVEFGALFAEGPEIGSEHIFTGPMHEELRLEYDLAENALVQWLLAGGGLALVRGATLALFVVIAVLCLVAGRGPAGRTANGLVWGLWWPVLVVVSVFIGRAWCMICPISLAGRLARRVAGFGLTLPPWMKKHTASIVLSLFVGIIWSEHVFEMARRPFATGILLAVLLTAAVGFCIVYQREVWCRYLCPLGGLAAGYSAAAMVHVRANPSVCATQCKTHECFKGGAAAPGCAVFHHPMYARDGQFCKLCLTCLRACTHDSAKLYLRPLLQGIWRLGSLSSTLVPFRLVLFFLVPVMLASHKLASLGEWLYYTGAVALAVGAGLASTGLLRRILVGKGNPDPEAVAAVALALLVLAAGPFMAFHLENIPSLAEIELRIPAGLIGSYPASPRLVPLLVILQFGVILASVVLAAIALWRIRVRLEDRDITPMRGCWIVLRVVCLVYLLASLGLVTLQGRHA